MLIQNQLLDKIVLVLCCVAYKIDFNKNNTVGYIRRNLERKLQLLF